MSNTGRAHHAKALVSWGAALGVAAAGAWLRLRQVPVLDLQPNEVGYVGASLADGLSLEGLRYYAPLRPLLTALALAISPSVWALRSLAWLPGALVPLAAFAALRRWTGAAPALAVAALLAFDEAQVWASVVSGVYALAVLAQIGAAAGHQRLFADADPRGARLWAVSALALVLAHYLLLPLVALQIATGWWASRGAPAAVATAWRRAAIPVAGLVALAGAFVAWGLVTDWARVVGGGLSATRAVGFLDLWRLDLVPFGLWRWQVNLGAVTLTMAWGLWAWRRAWGAWWHALGFGAVVLVAAAFLPRLQAYHVVLLHVPLLVLGAFALPPAPRPTWVRAGVAVPCLALVALAAALGTGRVRTQPRGWMTGDYPPYAPLPDLVATLEVMGDLPGPVLVHPPGVVTTLSLSRRPALTFAGCEDVTDAGGVVQAVRCPQGEARAVWLDHLDASLRLDALPTGPFTFALERVRIFHDLAVTPPDKRTWDARDVPAAALGLPATCRPVPSRDWLVYRCGE